ncbi:hypothetical protein SAPIO_CDS0405 [Scedosporium apiospermum]|uniref:Uncharacterized protein n=1 Tax=Pseudallescheria apiosperma TaxID=563466 RepID=A0A084GGY1_PSEDA|nr:uncharacterized protein SAPIO_CDS0405 [Scedosporium apiospermum]KEZ46593.1 hypothetical protein SAPIO_CDS0405 [Scedosporium apiospermum]
MVSATPMRNDLHDLLNSSHLIWGRFGTKAAIPFDGDMAGLTVRSAALKVLPQWCLLPFHLSLWVPSPLPETVDLTDAESDSEEAVLSRRPSPDTLPRPPPPPLLPPLLVPYNEGTANKVDKQQLAKGFVYMVKVFKRINGTLAELQKDPAKVKLNCEKYQRELDMPQAEESAARRKIASLAKQNKELGEEVANKEARENCGGGATGLERGPFSTEEFSTKIVRPILRLIRRRRTMETPLSLPDGNIVFPDICQQQRKRLGLGPMADQSLTKNPGHDVQPAAFDGSAPPRINLATYLHEALVSLGGRNVDVFDPTNSRNAAILEDVKSATAEHAHAVKTDADGGLTYIFGIAYKEYLCLPPSRRAEMLYFTLGKSPVLLRTVELCREWVPARDTGHYPPQSNSSTDSSAPQPLAFLSLLPHPTIKGFEAAPCILSCELVCGGDEWLSIQRVFHLGLWSSSQKPSYMAYSPPGERD